MSRSSPLNGLQLFRAFRESVREEDEARAADEDEDEEPVPSPLQQQPQPSPPPPRPGFCEANLNDAGGGVTDNLTLLLKRKRELKEKQRQQRRESVNPLRTYGYSSVEDVLEEEDPRKTYESSCSEGEDEDDEEESIAATSDDSDEEDEDYHDGEEEPQKKPKISYRGIGSSTLRRLPAGKQEEEEEEDDDLFSSSSSTAKKKESRRKKKRNHGGGGGEDEDGGEEEGGQFRDPHCFGCMFAGRDSVGVDGNHMNICVKILTENFAWVKNIVAARMAHCYFKQHIWRPGMKMWRTLEILDHLEKHSLSPSFYIASRIIKLRKKMELYEKMELITITDESGKERMMINKDATRLAENTHRAIMDLYGKKPENLNFYVADREVDYRRLGQLVTPHQRYIEKKRS